MRRNPSRFDKHPFVSRIRREADISSTERNIGDRWHSDQSPRERPNLGFALYCVEAPDHGGDTMFANMQIAYDSLSSGMKALCGSLIVVHSASGIDGDRGGRPLFHAGVKEDEGALQRTLAILEQETEHPLVRVCPETGRRCLYLVGDYAIRFKDMTVEESAPLLGFLQAHATRPEFTCRFRWRKGSLALLDNRCTQHVLTPTTIAASHGKCFASKWTGAATIYRRSARSRNRVPAVQTL